ncbi:MAG: glycosyltransferase family 4 protein [Candidatus Parcubacteria bacterium]|nr:glycosyltransferase family 4 protein [Candidatus Parcubacteria bacterium]
MVRIGIFDPYLDTLSGGEKYMLSIASCLAQEHDVFIFWDKDKETEIKKTTLRKLGIDLSSVKFYNNIFDKNISTVFRFFESKKFDAIIYLSDGSIPFVGTKLFVHFQFPIVWADGEFFKTKIKLFFVKNIFCNSYFTKSFIDKKLNINSKIIYPPIIMPEFRKVDKENIIIHVGRFGINLEGENYKKQDVMVNAFKKMVDDNLTDWKFILVIGSRKEDEVKLQQLKSLTKGYSIEIINNPSNNVLWEQYAKAKIYWHATGYGEDLQKYPEKAEHFGISTVEAMGAGCVPVVLNAGGQREIVENGKSGYLWNTLVDFAEKTNSLIKDEELWGKMSKEAVERSKMFTGNRFCREIKDIIG